MKMSMPRDLLIVPYGIETEECIHITESFMLLIVPYGIETISFQRKNS